MNVRAHALKPGMKARRGTVARPGAWVELADPPVKYTDSGTYLRLRFIDGTLSNNMPPAHLVEILSAEGQPT